MEDISKILGELKNHSPLMFHPIHETSSMAWFPSNEAAQSLVIISNTWEDIINILNIREVQKSKYNKKLLLKYVLVEIQSILEHIENLQGIVFKIITKKDDPNLHGVIKPEEEEIIRIRFKKYHIVKNEVGKDIVEIRNKIGAHRDNQGLWLIGELWNKLEPKVFQPLFEEITALFDVLKGLDIYDWTRLPNENSVDIYTSGLGDYKF